MNMRMGPINMGHDEKSMAALRPAHCRFIADCQRRFCVQLTGRERLADLIAQYIRIPPLLPARDGLVLGLAQKKLRVGGYGIALIGADQHTVQRLFRVLPIVETVRQGL